MDTSFTAFLLLFIAFLAIGIDHGYTRSNRHRRLKKNTNRSNDFDHLVFAQSWPQSVCFQWKKKKSNHTCNLPSGDEWTIHGIWPSMNNSTGPFFCNPKSRLNHTSLQGISGELNSKWRDVENHGRPENFLEHEWKKHGTCASSIESLNSAEKYFQKGLDLVKQYDIKTILAQSNIVPGRSYFMSNFRDGVRNVLKVNPQISCIRNQQINETYLHEVKICLNKQLNPVHCSSQGNCPRKKNILYPGNVPTTP